MMPSTGRGEPQQPPPPPPRQEGLGFVHGWTRYALASAALLVPCFWQSRIQAGDLGSHIYNAWLAELIRHGQAPGLAIVSQKTNVLFDLLLDWLFRAVGSAAAQRIAVSLAVLVFTWGAFAFIAAAARRQWAVLPAIAMLAYGWVYHMGLFNFYLSLGLCFWALALSWSFAPRRLLAAVPVLAVACVAHALTVVWACGALGLVWLARRRFVKRVWLLAGVLVAIDVLHIALAATTEMGWNVAQLRLVAGVDQVWVYNDKYWIPCLGLLLLFVALAVESIRRRGARSFFGHDLMLVLLATAAGVFLLPTWVYLPGYQHALSFIAERMSLAVGVLAVAAVATVGFRRWHSWVAAAAAAAFFLFLYADERALNRFEDQTRNVVAQLPSMARVVSNADADVRINALTHIIDRVCIERCYSFANYEPGTGQFRIRITGPTTIVAPVHGSSRIQNGEYVVEARDLPLYRISVAADDSLIVKSMAAGERTGISRWKGMQKTL